LQLAELERYYQQQQANRLMTEGVTLYDPSRLDIRGDVTVGSDSVIDVNVVFEGKVVVGKNVRIGPNCVISDAEIGDGVEIKANSVLEDCVVAQDCVIGPYARLRPGTELKQGAKIGNFVETKKSVIGEGSKVNHLTYIGDATIGKSVNVGAGTITCNYDGVNKFQTILQDGVFVGSNTSLVAPVTVAENATVAAGSVITQNIAAEQLGVARGKQRNIDGWQRPKKKS
jgi:bifunctional UDP-N-acetylglucosamine pyrophosphorylase/glucosamine-1-phosphate N-acetyltransferase